MTDSTIKEINRNTVADSIESLSHKLDMEDELQMELLKKEIERWHCFQLDIEKEFLTPQECELKWQ